MLYRIELFAEFMALLEEPFSDRAVVLSAAELDDARLASMLEAWRIRLDGDEKGELAEKYAGAYAARRAAIHRARERARRPARPRRRLDPRFLSREALGFREEAATRRVGSRSSRACPCLVRRARARSPRGCSSRQRRQARPFPRAISPPTLRSTRQRRERMPSYLRPSERLAGTADISSVVRGVALPFARSEAPRLPRAFGRASASSTAPATAHAGSGTADISSFVPRHLLPFSGNATPPRRAARRLPRPPVRSRLREAARSE